MSSIECKDRKNFYKKKRFPLLTPLFRENSYLQYLAVQINDRFRFRTIDYLCSTSSFMSKTIHQLGSIRR